jgi:hypothetical protein
MAHRTASMKAPTQDGSTEGSLDRLLEGIDEGVHDGILERSLDGLLEGLDEGTEDGITDGSLDGLAARRHP